MRYFALIILLFSFKLEGQYRFDFEIDSSQTEECCLTADWHQVPGQRWCCDSTAPIAGGSSMHHVYDNPGEGCDFLVLRHDPLDTRAAFSYSFRIRHGFLPSSQNNWQLAMGAVFEEGTDPGGLDARILEGIVVGVNYSGSDDLVKLWRLENGESVMLCSTNLNYQETAGSELAPLFLLMGDGLGSLDLYWLPDPYGHSPELLASCQIDGVDWGRQLVLRYRYTSSRDRALWLDDLVLEGTFNRDTVAPELRTLELEDPHTILLHFSEPVSLQGGGSFILYSGEMQTYMAAEPMQVVDEKIRIVCPEELVNRRAYELVISGVEDADGNRMSDTLVHIRRNEACWGDVVFNEIMADPDPAVRFDQEYLELYNRSEYPVDMNGWQLSVSERSYSLEVNILDPGSYLLLEGIILPNEGTTLALYNREGRAVHACTYGIPWDGPEWKKEGGWSLESPDADLVCRISAGWEYSGDPGGGTPGKPNSNLASMEDLEAPVFLYAGAGNPKELSLHFNESLQGMGDPPPAFEDFPASFRLDPGDRRPDSVRLADPLGEVLLLYFREDFREDPLYRLSMPPLGDCEGNRSSEEVLEAGAASFPEAGSLLINEIMYDPEEGKPEYVELFLPGNRVLDLRDLALHLVGEGASPDRPMALSPHSRLVLPGQYLLVTSCIPRLEMAYGLEVSGSWVEVSGLHGLNRSSGSIYLTDRAGNVVDMAAYNDGMHMALLNDTRGISLERLSGDRPGSDPDNWHSAASIEGYSTPGRENSQSGQVPEGEGLLEVTPEVFSPDNDGFEDLLDISVNTGGTDWIIGLFITDLAGNRIRTLANNHLAGPSLTYRWNGEDAQGSMLPMGFYVVHARGFRPATGESWIRRKAVGLLYR